MIKMIAAVSANGIMGIDNKLPFHHPEDLKLFKQKTTNHIVIMGRKTFESIGKPLPNRENIVISSTKLDISGIHHEYSLESAIKREGIILRDSLKDIWLIGGASIYEAGMEYAEEIHLTITSDIISTVDCNVVKFPWINPMWFSFNYIRNSPTCGLTQAIYTRLPR